MSGCRSCSGRLFHSVGLAVAKQRTGGVGQFFDAHTDLVSLRVQDAEPPSQAGGAVGLHADLIFVAHVPVWNDAAYRLVELEAGRRPRRRTVVVIVVIIIASHLRHPRRILVHLEHQSSNQSITEALTGLWWQKAKSIVYGNTYRENTGMKTRLVKCET